MATVGTLMSIVSSFRTQLANIQRYGTLIRESSFKDDLSSLLYMEKTNLIVSECIEELPTSI